MNHSTKFIFKDSSTYLRLRPLIGRWYNRFDSLFVASKDSILKINPQNDIIE